MSDLRASDRLLGVIGEEALAIDADIDAGVNIGALDLAMHSARISEAVAELRRRGDTLVRREDLMSVLAGVERGFLIGISVRGVECTAAWERLENTIGGTL
jgi:hypothetical protein